MKIIVCMKQVPAGTKVDIDPETGAMKRLSGDTRTNPYDLFALETALQLRELLGGTVTALTMGPPHAEEMMRDAYSMGADDAVILSDRKFAGSDVLATSYVLSQGIKVLGGADLIICGRQTTDGDTDQVGPAIAEHLMLPHAAWVAEIVKADQNSICVRQDLASVSQISEMQYPCLITRPAFGGNIMAQIGIKISALSLPLTVYGQEKILQQNTTGMKCRNMACFLLNFMSKSSTKKRFLPLWPMHTKKIFLSYAAVPVQGLQEVLPANTEELCFLSCA